MRIFKKYKVLLFLVLCMVLNSILCFLIEPANGSSDTMWREYFREKEIDTIFIGSSLCSATFDPLIFNERLGVKSFNLGTPMQPLNQNLKAVKTALRDHDIKTVIIGMGFFVFQEEPFTEAEVTFEKELARNIGGIQGIVKGIEYTFSEEVRGTEKSINYWFPWIYNKEGYELSLFKKNVTSKLAMFRGENQTEASKKGYRPYEGMVDLTNIAFENSAVINKNPLQQKQLDKFEELIKYCKEKKVDVFVVNTPHPKFDVLSYDLSYEEYSRMIQMICEKNEVDYYDFSLVKEELFPSDNKYYYDYEHLNYEGSQLFCEMLCDFMIRRENGESMDGYFYSIEEFFYKEK